jgi:16S rRNA (guanine527-N7)-methyltransferase
MDLTALLHQEEIKQEIDVTPSQIEQLETFTTLLHEWNRVHNLTGARSIEGIYANIVDALYPITFITKPKSLLDVGTGAGFPGLVLAIVLPETKVVLCEPLKKRVSFLKYVIMQLELTNVTVEAKRVEELKYEPFKLITSRAVTHTKLLFDLTQHLKDSHTRYLFYKGSQLIEELKGVTHQLEYDIVQKNQRNYLYTLNHTKGV